MTIQIALLDENNIVYNIIDCSDDYVTTSNSEVIIPQNVHINISTHKYDHITGLFSNLHNYRDSAREQERSIIDYKKDVALATTEHYINNDEWFILSDNQKNDISLFRNGINSINTSNVTVSTVVWPEIPSLLTTEEKIILTDTFSIFHL